MRFEAPWAFAALLCLPVLLALRLVFRSRRGLRFSSVSLGALVSPSLRQRLSGAPQWLRYAAVTVLVVALARPQSGMEQVRRITEGVAIEIVIDRSGSMGAEILFEGEQMSRLEGVKRVVREFIYGNDRRLRGRSNDLIGLVTFARFAETVLPLTLSHTGVSGFLSTIDIVRTEEEDGTAIGDALALAAARLQTAEALLPSDPTDAPDRYQIKSKAIILLTDGRNNFGRRAPLDAARLAEEWGIKIYSIGIGDSEIRTSGSPFQLPSTHAVDAQTLNSIAETTGGVFRLAEGSASLRDIFQEIDRLEKSEIVSLRYLDFRELFIPFAFAGMILLAIEVILSCTIFRRLP